MACTSISIPAALMTALAGLDGKYVTMISNAEFMCQVRGYLIDDMLIGKYRELVASQLGTALVYTSTTIMTIWVAYQGFMIISGGNRNPILPLFLKTGKMALIMSLVALIAGKSPVIAEAVLDFQGLITAAIVGAGTDIYQVIDINLAMAQVFNAVVDGLAGGQQAGADGKSLTTIAGLVGQSGPAVLVSVLAVMAEISITLAIMLAPLFIFFLLFQQTSAMFWTWAKFLLGTMVSLAVLTLLGSIVLDMMMRYGAAVVAAFYVNGVLSAAGVGAGFDIGGSAMQLAALGSLSTALLMMVPPLIMQFFNSGASFAAGAMMGAMGDRARQFCTTVVNESKTGQRITQVDPVVSLTFPTGQRAQFVLPPAVPADHVSITIRLPSRYTKTLNQYQDDGFFARILEEDGSISSMDGELLALKRARNYHGFFSKAVHYKKNIVVSGATGSGKTTFMKSLVTHIPDDERLITIEDARELFIEQPNRVHLIYSRGGQGTANVTAKGCMEACLRMKPDRIILAEIRGDESFYYIRNCASGHPGSITSCHAGSTSQTWDQMALMVKASPEGSGLAFSEIKRLLMLTIDVVVHIKAHAGQRYITGIDFDPQRKLALDA